MPRETSSKTSRGSTLLLVMILLAVLSLIGVAAVTVGEQDRANVAAVGFRDIEVSCAKAAQMVIFSELAKYGSSYLSSTMPVPVVVMPDGTQLTQNHYNPVPGVTVQSVTPARTVPISSNPQSAGTGNLSNRVTNGVGASTLTGYQVVALCTDPHGRQLEVEFLVAFSL